MKPAFQAEEMMKKIFIPFFAVFLTGCVTTGQNTVKSLAPLNHVTTGMTRDQVEAVMGDEVVVGYDMSGSGGNELKPITEKSLQRTQKIQKNGREYDIAYYLTHIRQPDDRTTDDELTPFIFEDNRLIAKGWYYLDRLLDR